MKTLRLAFLVALAVGCHFDKLFQTSGSTHAPPAGSTKNRLTFTTQPRSTMKDSTIPPVQVTAFDSTGTVVATFTGNVTVAIGYNGGLVSEGQLRRGSTQVAAVNGVATFANLSIDQIGSGYTLTAAAASFAGDTSTDFNHYTKRMTLGAVYGSTLLVWLDDKSEGWSDTAAFLDRRIDDVMRFEKFKAEWRGSSERPSLSRFLGRLRYPPR